MCGIVGILNRDSQKAVDSHQLNRMIEVVSHRGPDDKGVFLSGPVGLGHKRLAVIDLVSGHQPMTDKERGVALVYNGEIYNYRELRQDLIKKGFVFKTNSDTEVLLYLSEFSSFDWLEKLNGMFAFAIWEESLKTLLLGRDRMGIKPLYYAKVKDAFLFSSEIKALLSYPEVKREVNYERIPEYLAFRSICGNETMFKGIYEFPPGHVMLFSQKDFDYKMIRFWEDNDNKRVSCFVDQNASFEDQFKEILLSAVNYRLISDVPVGTFNSGGVDSSLITAMVRSITQGELHTFSVGFEEASYDESEYAQIVADKLGTNHHALVINERLYVDTLQETLYSLEEPINHAHTVQLLLLSRLAKEYVTVVLTGEGADELFAGYPRYQIPLLTKYLNYFPKGILKNILLLFRHDRMRKVIKLFENSHDINKSVTENSRFVPRTDFELLYPDFQNFTKRDDVYRSATLKPINFLERLLYFDRKTYLPALLNRLDKTSMAASLEARVAFLDYRLIEWSSTLPEKTKIKLGRANKYIVKKVAEKYLPKEIVFRKKVGFGVPISNWLRNPKGLGQYLDILTDKTFKERGYFDNNIIRRFIDEHCKETKDHGEILWSLLNLELWHRLFIDNNVVSNKEALHTSPSVRLR